MPLDTLLSFPTPNARTGTAISRENNPHVGFTKYCGKPNHVQRMELSKGKNIIGTGYTFFSDYLGRQELSAYFVMQILMTVSGCYSLALLALDRLALGLKVISDGVYFFPSNTYSIWCI